MTADRTPFHAAVLSTGLLALSGCTQLSGGLDGLTTASVFGTPSQSAYAHAVSERVSADVAFVSLPAAAGSVSQVMQTVHANGIAQRIVLAGDLAVRGENGIEVRLVTSAVQRAGDGEPLAAHARSEAAIAARMRKAVPGVEMRWSRIVTRNAHGAFGYAVGDAGNGVRCLYGWQSVADRAPTGWGIFAKASSRSKLSLRVRLCRQGWSEERLVHQMRQLRIDADPAVVAARREAPRWGNGGEAGTVAALPGEASAGYRSHGPLATPEPATVRAPSKPVRKKRKSARRADRRKPVKAVPAQKATRPDPRLAGVQVPVPPDASPLAPAVRKAVIDGAVPLLPPRLPAATREPAAVAVVPLPPGHTPPASNERASEPATAGPQRTAAIPLPD